MSEFSSKETALCLDLSETQLSNYRLDDEDTTGPKFTKDGGKYKYDVESIFEFIDTKEKLAIKLAADCRDLVKLKLKQKGE